MGIHFIPLQALCHFYRATPMHSADYAVARCLSVRLSHAGILWTPLNISSNFFYHHVAPSLILVFPYRTLWQYSDGDPECVECNWMWRNRDFWPISHFISEMMQVRAIVTMEGEYETVPKLSNGAISNDLEWSLYLQCKVTILFNVK